MKFWIADTDPSGGIFKSSLGKPICADKIVVVGQMRAIFIVARIGT